jgi:hypothetical protein
VKIEYEKEIIPILNFNGPLPLVDMNVTLEYMHFFFQSRAETMQAAKQNGDRHVARCVQYHHRLLE